MNAALLPGPKHELRFVVPVNRTVPALLPESEEFLAMPSVFATGFLVSVLEWACMQVVRLYLDSESEITLGIHLDVSHCAPTPPGLEVRVNAGLVQVSGRRLLFNVSAHDGIDVISEGRHERALVDRARFDQRLDLKRSRIEPSRRDQAPASTGPRVG